ncbi:Lsr2 family protein [Dietzia sp. 179-F 9C3 NHS]|uniref:Lsr2 family protein n=1 Tax=Dietzia sp. 179-F 9C3 NHS TaxID=3374295 RepID=UPI00387A6F32
MSRRVLPVFTDDLDGSIIDDPNHSPTRLAIDGKELEIDLSAPNRDQLLAALAPYIENARRVTGTRRRRAAARPAAGRDKRLKIRQWAAANGYEVASRGRIAADIVDAYEAAR